ncbi:MAG: GlxA family transcriptional regulator [Proteobacteria bacterium]|nr:GlxA family transcriptional regulator [Pseudomonadota bacterium]
MESRPRQRLTRTVAVLVYPDAQALDAVGPLEVFSTANRLHARRRPGQPAPYDPFLVAREAGGVRVSAGYELVARHGVADVAAPVDTLVIAGGEGSLTARHERALIDWISAQAAGARRVASVCTGAHLLAETGLLDGRRATTHWYAADELAAEYPQVQVDADPIFLKDGRFYTSAGVTSGMDLALALVEEDLGRRAALTVARWLVLFLKRPGGQSQFSAPLVAQLAEREPLRELQAWVPEHLNHDLSVPALARQVGMSPRNFARVFTREVGCTPARFVEQARIEAARRALEESDAGVEAVAARCGFQSAEVMRRSFLRAVHVSPSDYRNRFRRSRVA